MCREGLIMAEKALFSSNVNSEDWGYLFILYILLNVIRGVSVVLAFPILSRGTSGTIFLLKSCWSLYRCWIWRSIVSILPSFPCRFFSPAGVYGINWRQAILLSYSGLRGAVGKLVGVAFSSDRLGCLQP